MKIDLFEGLGHRAVFSHPKQTRAIAAAHLKNDRGDAERLALLLRGDLLPTVWIPPAETREARELLRHRLRLIRRPRSIPGVGPLFATLLVLERGDIRRFPSAKHLASSGGLTPRGRASANWVRLGPISKGGNRHLRWALIAAATQAARRPAPLRA